MAVEPRTEPFTAERLRLLRRIAREARNTYVGSNWPTMEDMRHDGIGAGLAEDRKHERFIRRYLDTFQPDFLVQLLETWEAERAALRAIESPAHPETGLREAVADLLVSVRASAHPRSPMMQKARRVSAVLAALAVPEPKP